MSKLKLVLGVSVFLIVVYVIAWVLNAADPFSYIFFAIAGLYFIGAILMRLKIVESGKLLGRSALYSLLSGIGFLFLGYAIYNDSDLFIIPGGIILLISMIIDFKANKALKTE